MEYLIGFTIAMLIGLTGVGGGVITAPVLTLFLGVPPAVSVGTSLVFTAIVKLAAMPLYIARRQVNYRILVLLLAGGLPGVLVGSYFLTHLDNAGHKGPLMGLLGATIVLMAVLNLYRLFFGPTTPAGRSHSRWLPLVALPIGAEVGFSSAGAGALGTLALMTLTAIPAAQVIGTDLVFGLGLSLAGGGLTLGVGNYSGVLVMKLAAGGLVGAFVGASLLTVLPQRPLRVGLAIWLVSMGGQLCWRALAG
jgi:uncharacterized protein